MSQATLGMSLFETLPRTGSVEDRMQAFDIDVVETTEGLSSLEAEWASLYGRSAPTGNPFQSFGWCWHWARHFLKPGRVDLFVVTAREKGRLLLIWPLVRERTNGLSRLTWIGSPLTQYGDVLVDPSAPESVLYATWRHIKAQRGIDVIEFYKVREDARVAHLLPRIGAVAIRNDTAPFVDMSAFATFEDYADQRYSKKRLKQLARFQRRFEEIGDVRLEIVHAGERARSVAAEIMDVKEKWLRSRAMISRALDDPRTREFFLDAVADTTRTTDARLSVLRCGNEIIGAEINFMAGGHCCTHIIAHNVEFERWKPGHLTTLKGLEQLKSEGIQVFDFLGPFAPFKMDWADGTVGMTDWAVPISLKGGLWARVYLGFARDRLKALYKRLPTSIRSSATGAAAALLVLGKI